MCCLYAISMTSMFAVLLEIVDMGNFFGHLANALAAVTRIYETPLTSGHLREDHAP